MILLRAVALSLSALLATSPAIADIEIPKKKPLGRYQQLWRNSSFGLVTAEKAQAVPANELEATVAKLKADGAKPPAADRAAKEGDPIHQWLQEHSPKPITDQNAQTNLTQLANREAQRRGLVVKRRKLLPSIEGKHYHRVRTEIEVSGKAQTLCQWIDRLQAPNEFRGISFLRIHPKRDDATMVDCNIILEQWFVPKDVKRPERILNEVLGELTTILETQFYPLEILYQISQAFPQEPVRFERVDILNEPGQGKTPVRTVTIQGKGHEREGIKKFFLNLKNSEDLASYGWNTPPPVEGKKAWSFVCRGDVVTP